MTDFILLHDQVFWMDNFLLNPDIKEGLRRGVLRIALKPTQKLQMIALEDLGIIYLASSD
jgi:hypothetical protein